MRAIIPIVSCFFCSIAGIAQNQISGYVFDKKGSPIIGANVYIKDSYDGGSSDVNGSFSFPSDQKDMQQLLVTSIGYETHKRTINISGNLLELEIVLKESVNKLDAVVISAGSFSAGEESQREVLKPLDIVTTAGASGDITGVFNTLPGTQTVGEEGRLFVRGGSGDETKTFIDGMQVANAYNPSIPNTPGRGRFSAMMFKGTSFSTGGYSAEYGQALSSALILNSKDVSLIDRVDLSLMSVGVDAALTKVWENSSFSGKIQHTNLSPYFGLVKQSIDLEESPKSWNGNFAFRQKLSKNGMLKFYSNINHSTLVSNLDDINDPNKRRRFDLTNDYIYINSSYKEIINEKWSIKSGLSYSYNKDNIAINEDQILENQKVYHAKVVVGFDPSEQLAVSFGSEYINQHFFQNVYPSTSLEEIKFGFDEAILASFMEIDIFTSNKLLLKSGIRWEYNRLNKKSNFGPRLSMGYKISDNSQISLAYGQFQQSVNKDYLKFDPSLSSEKANHYILNYQWQSSNRTFRTEIYSKRYLDLLKFDGPLNSSSSNFTNNGDGFANGLDIFWRDNKTFKNVDYWVSYSYLDTKREYLNYPQKATPIFASTHNFSFVYKHFISEFKSQIGCTYSFGSGRPFHDPNTDGFNQGVTRNYHDLSMNVSYLWKSKVILHAFVTNVTGRKNVFGYEFASQPDDQGIYASRPIKPMAPRFLFLGIFFTLSKDKSLNELPNL